MKVINPPTNLIECITSDKSLTWFDQIRPAATSLRPLKAWLFCNSLLALRLDIDSDQFGGKSTCRGNSWPESAVKWSIVVAQYLLIARDWHKKNWGHYLSEGTGVWSPVLTYFKWHKENVYLVILCRVSLSVSCIVSWTDGFERSRLKIPGNCEWSRKIPWPDFFFPGSIHGVPRFHVLKKVLKSFVHGVLGVLTVNHTFLR